MPDVRMSDISRYLGVSTVTVSKALAGKDGVSDELRARIQQIAAEMGYQKKSRAKQAGYGTYAIGIILTERLRKPEHSFYWALCMSLIDTLKERGYYNMVEIIREDQEAQSSLPDFVGRKKVDGVVVLGAMDATYLDTLGKVGLPLVLVDFYRDNFNAVSIIPDSFLGGYAVTAFLLEKGHRRVGFVGSIDLNNNAQDRYYGYCKALRMYGIPLRDDWIVPNRDVSGILQEKFDLPVDMPTAFFCDCDQSAYHFARDLRSKGYRIPEEVSVAGFYDHVYATLTEPGLTTYQIGVRRMADAAARALLDRIQTKDNSPERIIISGKMIERGSVAGL